jgi:hypothetical protein
LVAQGVLPGQPQWETVTWTTFLGPLAVSTSSTYPISRGVPWFVVEQNGEQVVYASTSVRSLERVSGNHAFIIGEAVKIEPFSLHKGQFTLLAQKGSVWTPRFIKGLRTSASQQIKCDHARSKVSLPLFQFSDGIAHASNRPHVKPPCVHDHRC